MHVVDRGHDPDYHSMFVDASGEGLLVMMDRDLGFIMDCTFMARRNNGETQFTDSLLMDTA